MGFKEAKKVMLIIYKPRGCYDECPLARWNDKEQGWECQYDGEVRYGDDENMFYVAKCPLKPIKEERK